MNSSPDDRIDPYETRLARRVSEFSEQALRPFDPAAIAATAHASARRSTPASRLFGSSASFGRLGLLLAGAAIAAASFGIFIAGAGPTPSEGPATSLPSPAEGVVADCAATNLAAEITAWDGAAGHRIATVRLIGGNARCKLPSVLRPALVDAGGRALIVGARPKADREWDVLGPGDFAETMVDMANYCGPEPTGGLFLRLYLSETVAIDARAAASIASAVDPPPCNGPNVPATIEIQPLGQNVAQ